MTSRLSTTTAVRSRRNWRVLILLLVANVLLVGQLDIQVSKGWSEETYPTDADLKKSIAQQVPSWTNLSDWDRVNVIRHWVAERVITGSSYCLPQDNATFHFYEQNASTLLNAFSKRLYGVMCGGTAYLLEKTYQLFDYESYVVNMGKMGIETHVITLVDISYQSKRILSVQDAYFDISFTDGQRRPLDYFAMLALLRDHKHDHVNIFPSDDATVTRYAMWRANETVTSAFPHSDDFTVLQGERRLYGVNMSLALYSRFDPKARKFADFLASQGYPRDIVYMYLFPFEVNGYNVSYLDDPAHSSRRETSILRTAVWLIRGGCETRRTNVALLAMSTASVVIAALFFYSFYKKRRKRSRKIGETKATT